jgi:hypothetical protein
VCCVCLVGSQRTNYGFGYGCLWSLAGLVHAPRGGCLSSPSAAGYGSLRGTRLHRLQHQERGTVFAIKYLPWAQPKIINRFTSLAAPVAMEGAQDAAISLPVRLRFEG